MNTQNFKHFIIHTSKIVTSMVDVITLITIIVLVVFVIIIFHRRHHRRCHQFWLALDRLM